MRDFHKIPTQVIRGGRVGEERERERVEKYEKERLREGKERGLKKEEFLKKEEEVEE